MSAQMVRFHGALGGAAHSAGELRDRLTAAEAELATLKAAAGGGAGTLRAEQRAAARALVDRAALSAQLAAARSAAAAAAEAAGSAVLERQLAAQGAQEGREACTRLHARVAAAVAAKQATRHALLGRSEEMCGLFEQSAELQRELDAGEWMAAACHRALMERRVTAARAGILRHVIPGQRRAPCVLPLCTSPRHSLQPRCLCCQL